MEEFSKHAPVYEIRVVFNEKFEKNGNDAMVKKAIEITKEVSECIGNISEKYSDVICYIDYKGPFYYR